MIRKTTVLAAAAAALVTGAVAVPLSANASTDKVVRLQLVETSVGFHSLDVPGAAADGQAGDIGTFESVLTTKAGRKVGSLAGSCIQLRADGTLDNCQVGVTVGTDTYQMSGLFDPATGSPLTITGGTGRFVGAAGVDSIANQPDGTAIHTITLVRS